MTLIFVYNADGGLVNGFIDLVHKTVSPQSYACSLCAVTYGPLGMKRAWREFTAGLGRPVRFLHRDELAAAYGRQEVALPALFEERPAGLALLLDAQALNGARTLEDLMALVARTLAAHA